MLEVGWAVALVVMVGWLMWLNVWVGHDATGGVFETAVGVVVGVGQEAVTTMAMGWEGTGMEAGLVEVVEQGLVWVVVVMKKG